jgi:hypothetical protein
MGGPGNKISLSHGDHLILGPRALKIEVEDVAGIVPPSMSEVQHGEGEVDDDDEQTRPGSLSHGLSGAEHGPTSIHFHTCPKCRTKVAFGDSVCGSCGYAWADDHPSAVTGRVTLRNIDREPVLVGNDVPVVYGSEELTLDALVSDLTTDRAFVPSPLLDPNHTSCELTLLPDGIHAMTVAGVVTSVRATANAAGPAGMEVRFTEVPAAVRSWIERWMLARRR